jgi:hypothetical protein
MLRNFAELRWYLYISVKIEQNDGHFTWRLTCVSACISQNICWSENVSSKVFREKLSKHFTPNIHMFLQVFEFTKLQNKYQNRLRIVMLRFTNNNNDTDHAKCAHNFNVVCTDGKPAATLHRDCHRSLPVRTQTTQRIQKLCSLNKKHLQSKRDYTHSNNSNVCDRAYIQCTATAEVPLGKDCHCDMTSLYTQRWRQSYRCA